MAWSDPWDTLWGGPAAVPTLRDTLYYGVDNGSGIADLAVDQSQYLDNMTAAATWHYEAAPGTRFNLASGWCFEFEFEADNADTGRLFNYDCATAASDLSLRISAGGIMQIIINNSIPGTSITLPGISGSDQRFLFAWSSMANPDTTGAADALLHFLSAWNLDTGAFDRVSLTTVVRPTQTGAMVIWADTTGGSNPFTGTPHAVRVSQWMHTPTETWEEMSGQLTTPTLLGEERMAVDVPPVSSTAGDDGQFAGPMALLGAAAARANDLRLAGPLVNVIYRSRPLLEGDLGAQNVAWLYEDPSEAAGMYLYLAYTHRADIPPACNRAHVRAFVQVNGASDLDVACYSMSQPGIFYRPPTSPVTLGKYRAEVTVSGPHGSGGTDGAWVDLGLLRIAQDLEGCSYFILGFRAAAGPDVWRVKALAIDPVLEVTANGPVEGG